MPEPVLERQQQHPKRVGEEERKSRDAFRRSLTELSGAPGIRRLRRSPRGLSPYPTDVYDSGSRGGSRLETGPVSGCSSRPGAIFSPRAICRSNEPPGNSNEPPFIAFSQLPALRPESIPPRKHTIHRGDPPIIRRVDGCPHPPGFGNLQLLLNYTAKETEERPPAKTVKSIYSLNTDYIIL